MEICDVKRGAGGQGEGGRGGAVGHAAPTEVKGGNEVPSGSGGGESPVKA